MKKEESLGKRGEQGHEYKTNGVTDLEVKVEDVHLVHVLKPFTDLAYKQHRVQLRQVVVLINDAVKQLPSLHAARKGGL